MWNNGFSFYACYKGCYKSACVGVPLKHRRPPSHLVQRQGVWHFRRAVPRDAREVFGGKREYTRSLDTRDLAEARHRMVPHARWFDRMLAEHRGRRDPTNLSRFVARTPDRGELEAAVRTWLKARIERAPVVDRKTAGERLRDLSAASKVVSAGFELGGSDPNLSTRWIADGICDEHGWSLATGSREFDHLCRLVARAQDEAVQWEQQDILNKPRVVGDTRFGPEAYRGDEARASEHPTGPVPILDLWEGYKAERQPSDATVKAWTRHINAFIAHLGHSDATKVDPADAVAWKDRLLSEVSPSGKAKGARTVRDTYLAAVKAVFAWAVENHRLRTNPAERIKVRAPKRVVLRDERGLSEAEADMILRATLEPPSSRTRPQYALARRWVPWLCAYTGARVNEMTQLRAEDVRKVGDVWTIRITPEAGSVKNRKARTVALHSHLRDQGFLQVVEGKSGPIFYDPALGRGGSNGNPQYKKVAERLAAWVRELGVSDPEVQPNHGWRHRFKSQARVAGMSEEVRDMIQGHVPATEGRAYGDFPPTVTSREIEKLPRYKVPGVIFPEARHRRRAPGSGVQGG